MLPFHLDTTKTNAAAIHDPDHGWPSQHQAWNGGQMDNWVPAQRARVGDFGPLTMGYYTRNDIPLHYALADAFTICDHYHCSVMGPTWPNRLHAMTGTIDPAGANGGPNVATNVLPPSGGFTWTTYAERLQAAGISWRSYASRVFGDGPELGWFRQFQTAPVGSPAGKPQHATWSPAELRTFLGHTAADRLAAVWRLAGCGLRRGELCGLRWEDTDFAAGTISIGVTRVIVNGEIVTKRPKSARGYRTLPLDDVTVTALRSLHDLQQCEASDAASAYSASGFVAADELGAPVHPEWVSDEFLGHAAAAGLPRIRLHDVRHSANSAMAAANVPDHVCAAFLGHTTAVNVGTYTHARPEDMRVAGAALAAVFGAV